MNLPAADSLGPNSIFDVLAPPTPLYDDAPAEMSFDTVLNKPIIQPPNCPLADCRAAQEQQQQPASPDAHQSSGEMTSETTDPTPPEDEPVIASGKRGSQADPNDDEEDDPDETVAAIIVPTVVLDELPAVEQVDEVTQAGSELAADRSEKVAPRAQSVVAAVIDPTQSIQVAGVASSADDEPVAVQPAITVGHDAAAILAATVPGKHADRGRRSSDMGQKPARDPGQPVKHQAETVGETAVSLESAAAGNVEAKNAALTVVVARAAETAPSAIMSSATTHLQQPPAPRLLPELLSAATGRSTRDADAPQVDSVRLLNRVARAFVAAQDGSGEVRLRLSPPELGALRLVVKVLDGALVARLETETSAARTALIENLPALRERLAEQGVRIERFDVDLRQHHSHGPFDRQANQQPQDQPSQPQVAPRERRLPQVAEGVIARAAMIGPDQRRLNVIV